MHPPSEILIGADVLATRVGEMGQTLRSRFAEDEVIHVVGVLSGSFVFMADLVRATPGPLVCDFVATKSYEGVHTTGTVTLTRDLQVPIVDRHVVLVEDIVDTGLTIEFLRSHLQARQPLSLTVVTLLDKPSRRQVVVQVDEIGFTIEDRFVVGYGLDADGLYRNLPHIAVLPTHDSD